VSNNIVVFEAALALAHTTPHWKESVVCRIFATIGPDEGRRMNKMFAA
jgi:hypothetical protein